jgi:hypothetical protein
VCAKVVATLGTYPYQVIRSLMQQRQQVGRYVSKVKCIRYVRYAYRSRGRDRSLPVHSMCIAGCVALPCEISGTARVKHATYCSLTRPRARLLQVGYDRVALDGTAATAAKLWREEGVRGFYRGLGTSLVRSTPQASLTLLAYENLLRLFSTGRGLNVVAPA